MNIFSFINKESAGQQSAKPVGESTAQAHNCADSTEEIKGIFFSIIRKSFPGGINPSSIIDRKKFSRIFSQNYEGQDSGYYADEDSILELARSVCIPVGEKYYAIDQAALDYIKHLADSLLARDINTVFYNILWILTRREVFLSAF